MIVLIYPIYFLLCTLTPSFVSQLKFIMEVEMCLLFIIDDATSELVCPVRSCDITINEEKVMWYQLELGK